MVKKTVDKEISENLEVEVPEKKKRVLSEKQLEALAEGRKRGVEKLKQKGAITKEKQEEIKQIKQIKVEEKIDEIEDLRKINSLHDIRKKVDDMYGKINILETVNNKFDNFLKEKQERRKMKDDNTIKKTIEERLPQTVSDMYVSLKIKNELSKSSSVWDRL
jgi:hypothetical protein